MLPESQDRSERTGHSVDTKSAQRDDFEAYSLAVSDDWGVERRGIIARVDSLGAETRNALAESAPNFVIALLSAPDEDSVSFPNIVICEPSRPIVGTSMVRETAPAYNAGGSDAPCPLTSDEITLYRRGRVVAPDDLDLQPATVFDNEPVDFRSVARRIVRKRQDAEVVQALALALSAPEPSTAANIGPVLRDLRRLAKRVQDQLDRLDTARSFVAQALDRVKTLTSARKPQTLIAAAAGAYVEPAAAVEEVFLLRAVADHTPIVDEVFAMQSFLDSIGDDADRTLTLEGKLVREQLQFAGLVPEPRLFATAAAAFEHFRRRYRDDYSKHHANFWGEMSSLGYRLRSARGRAPGLHRLNSISELGPPLAMNALTAYAELAERDSACDTPEPNLGQGAVCPTCHLRLDDSPPYENIEGTLKQIDEAIRQQMVRLASAAVQQTLTRSGDPRIDRFLRVVQAAQISSLVELLDDELTGFLRRFLVEARVGLVLEPLFTSIAVGNTPDPQLREMRSGSSAGSWTRR